MPRAGIILALAVVAGAAGAAPLPVKVQEKPLRFEVPRPQRAVLANGVVVYLLQDPALPAVELGANFLAGGADDPPGLAGLADVSAEAMRSGGAGERDAATFEDELAQLAAHVEHEISADLTRFSLWSLRSSLPRALDLFADLLRRPRLAGAAVRTARELRAGEAKREDDDPQRVVVREFTRRLFAGHPYGNWPTQESVSGLGRAEVREFCRRHFRPANLVLTAAGDFDSAEMLERLGVAFGDWRDPGADEESAAEGPSPGGGEPAEGEPVMAPPAGPLPGIVVLPRELAQTNLMFGHRGPRWDDPDLPALDLLEQILSYYRYFMDVRDNQGLAYAAYAGFGPRRRGGMLQAYAGTRAEAAARTLDLMRRHLREVAEGRFSDAEAAGARETVQASFLHRFDTAAKTVQEFALAEMRGLPPDWLPTYAKRVASLTPADLRRAARKHIHPEDLLVVVLGEPEPFETSPAR